LDKDLDLSDPFTLMFAHAERWMLRARKAEAEAAKLRDKYERPPGMSKPWR